MKEFRYHAKAIAIMPTLDDAFPAVCDSLVAHFGEPETSFEGLAPFETVVAVLLDRELGDDRWPLALEALAESDLLTPDRLSNAAVPEISDALRQKGVSASASSIAPLKHLARWLVDHHGGRVDSFFDPHRSTDWLRGELAAIRGIGLATADAIVLYALKRPSYPVDRATFRVLVRHDWLDPTAGYDEARDLLVDHATDRGAARDEDATNRLIELAQCMERLGRRYCRAASPRCEGCPLECLLPEGGPRAVDA
jgi:endonuclease-3 related protein